MPAKKVITKEIILDTALQVLCKDGIEAVNVKNLAKEMHCSTQPIYLSFEGMDQLREALIQAAVAKFEELLGQESVDGSVQLYGIAYIQLAKKQPQLFRFLFMREHAFEEIRQTLQPLLEQEINRFMKKYRISYDEAHQFHDQLWMHAHGIASMIATGFCDWDMEKVERMIRECYASFSRKYEA